jgi:hypothetical protein
MIRLEKSGDMAGGAAGCAPGDRRAVETWRKIILVILLRNYSLNGGNSMMVDEQKKENVTNLIELGKTKGNSTYDEIAMLYKRLTFQRNKSRRSMIKSAVWALMYIDDNAEVK